MPKQHVALLLLATVSLAGCGKRHPDRLPVCPTRGEAALAGKPATGALLIFHPTAAITLPALPHATVSADGGYAVGTYEGDDGLPEGEYAVTVLWTVKAPGADETVEGQSRVNAKFLRKETTPLKATVVREANGRCSIPAFQLTR